jgi:predicted RNA-binding Zn ribbon-like protein
MVRSEHGKRERARPETIRLAGGTLCLDFANSVDWADDGTTRPPNTDALSTIDDLVVWGRRLGILRGRGAVHVTSAHLEAARNLRKTVRAIFVAIAAGHSPDRELLDGLSTAYAEAAARAVIRRRDGAWRATWSANDARSVADAAATDAVALLGDPQRITRVRECPGHNCGWLFVDASGRRRWCSMEVCGSRAKMRRLYHRQKSRGDQPT